MIQVFVESGTHGRRKGDPEWYCGSYSDVITEFGIKPPVGSNDMLLTGLGIELSLSEN